MDDVARHRRVGVVVGDREQVLGLRLDRDRLGQRADQLFLVGVGAAILGATFSMLRLSEAGSQGAERVRVRDDQRLKGE